MISKITLTDIKNLFVILFFTGMLLGIAIFAVYFTEIQYFPVNNLTSILYLPVIAGLTGFVLLVCFAGLVGIAPYMWSELLKYKNFCRCIVGEMDAGHVMGAYEAGFVDLTQKYRIKIFWWYLGTMIFCISLWALAVTQDNGFFLKTLLLSGLCGFYGLFLNKKNNPPLVRSLKNKKIVFLGESIKIIGYSLLPSLALFSAIFILGIVADVKDTFFQTVLAITIIFNSTICLLPFSKKWKLLNWTVAVSIGSTIFLTIVLGVSFNVSKNIIRLFKFGNINSASIVVDEEGCDIFKLNGFKIDCNSAQKRYKINGVNVLWRANEYYVQDAERKSIKFIFAEKQVLSISIPSNLNHRN